MIIGACVGIGDVTHVTPVVCLEDRRTVAVHIYLGNNMLYWAQRSDSGRKTFRVLETLVAVDNSWCDSNNMVWVQKAWVTTDIIWWGQSPSLMAAGRLSVYLARCPTLHQAQACTRRQMWWHRPKITYWPGHHMTWSERRGELKNPTLYRTPVVLRLHSLTIYLPDNHPLSLSLRMCLASLCLSLWSFRLGFVFLNNIRFFLWLGYFL